MMQIKFNFNNFIFFGVCLPQLGSVQRHKLTPSSLATVIGLFNNDVISLRSLRSLLVSVAHWHNARWAWNGFQPGLGSIPRPGWI